MAVVPSTCGLQPSSPTLTLQAVSSLRLLIQGLVPFRLHRVDGRASLWFWCALGWPDLGQIKVGFCVCVCVLLLLLLFWGVRARVCVCVCVCVWLGGGVQVTQSGIVLPVSASWVVLGLVWKNSSL